MQRITLLTHVLINTHTHTHTHTHEATAYRQKEVKDVLVVLVLHVPPAHPVTLARAPLVHEDVLGEEVLHLLVGHVDAQLLKAVHLQVLEAGHVQKTYAGSATLAAAEGKHVHWNHINGFQTGVTLKRTGTGLHVRGPMLNPPHWL